MMRNMTKKRKKRRMIEDRGLRIAILDLYFGRLRAA